MLPSDVRIQLTPSRVRVLARRASSCDLFGIDAYAEDDLGYAPS
ncbi:MAG: hypothetical protein ACM3QS_05670 [Bacteroidota bacterium]